MCTASFAGEVSKPRYGTLVELPQWEEHPHQEWIHPELLLAIWFPSPILSNRTETGAAPGPLPTAKRP